MTETYTLSETLHTLHKFHFRSGAQPPRHHYIATLFNKKNGIQSRGFENQIICKCSIYIFNNGHCNSVLSIRLANVRDKHRQQQHPTPEQFPYHFPHTCKADSKCQAFGCLAAQLLHVVHQHIPALDMALEGIHTPVGANSSLLGHDGLEAGSCQSGSSHPLLDMLHCCNLYLKTSQNLQVGWYVLYYLASNMMKELCAAKTSTYQFKSGHLLLLPH